MQLLNRSFSDVIELILPRRWRSHICSHFWCILWYCTFIGELYQAFFSTFGKRLKVFQPNVQFSSTDGRRKQQQEKIDPPKIPSGPDLGPDLRVCWVFALPFAVKNCTFGSKLSALFKNYKKFKNYGKCMNLVDHIEKSKISSQL